MARDYHIAATNYRPKPVKVLFIAESPPAFSSDSKQAYFFFDENPGGDILFATIAQAVLGITYRKRGEVPKAEILQELKSKGYWLMDAVEYPINKIDGRKTSDNERKRFIDTNRSKLLERVASLRVDNQTTDMPIIMIKNLVYECLAEPLRQGGYSVPQAGPIGFPRYHCDSKTVIGIKSALANCHAPN
jgi:hypothetical protein